MAADPSAILTAVTGTTDDPHVIEAMMLGADLESGWDPVDVGDGSYGAFQFQQGASPEAGTIADFDNPTWEANAIEPRYAAVAATIPDALWTSNPEEAAEETAYGAERPQVDYYQGQGTAKVNASWAATRQVLVGAAPASATLTRVSLNPITDIEGVASSSVSSVTKIAMEVVAVAAGLGLVVIGAVKTASPSTSITGLAKQGAETAAMA